jgi:hypothetical protein
MLSLFYYNKKYKGFILALFLVLPHFFHPF